MKLSEKAKEQRDAKAKDLFDAIMPFLHPEDDEVLIGSAFIEESWQDGYSFAHAEISDNCISLSLHESRMKMRPCDNCDKLKYELEDSRWFIGEVTKYVCPGDHDTKDSALRVFKELKSENDKLKETIKLWAPIVLDKVGKK